MKKIFLISFLLASILSFGQHSGYTKQNLKMQWIAGAFDSTLHIPTGSGAPSGLRTGAWTGSGAVYVDTTNNVLYFYSGGSWRNSGSATAYVDSLYNSNDSLIYVKNGNAFYIGNLSNTTVVSNQGNHVLSGMVVSYISGLTYHVGPGYYMIEQVVYHFTGGDVTLDAADGSDARLDLIYIDNTMTLGTIDGTPGETTVTPIEDATTQLGLTTALVAALATTPSNIIDTVIRDEGSAGEWTISKTMTTNDSYATNPYHGSISQRITGASTGQYIEWIAGSVQSKLRYTNLVFYIRNNSALSSARTFRIGLYNGTTSVGNVLNASLYGYDRAVTGTYMVVAFPMGDFGGADAFDRVRLQNTGIGGTIDVQVDYIRLQANGANNVGSSGVTNITATNNYAQTWTISNPTTTPNLSLGLDTSLIATKLALKKSIDSVVAIANSLTLQQVTNNGFITDKNIVSTANSGFFIRNSTGNQTIAQMNIDPSSGVYRSGQFLITDTLGIDVLYFRRKYFLNTNDTVYYPLYANRKDTMATLEDIRSGGGGSSTLSGLTDANISSPSNLQLLQFQTGDNKWHNWTPNYLSSVDTTNISNFSVKVRSLLSATAPLTYNSGTGAIGITQATTSTNGYLSSTDWNTFNNKLSAMAIGGAVTSGTSGSILYVNSSGNLAQDNGNLFYDATNKAFGIGTTSPYANLGLTNGTLTVVGGTGAAGGIGIITSARNDNSIAFGTGFQVALENSSNNLVPYAYFNGIIESNTAGSHNGRLAFFTATNGSLTEKFRVNSNGNLLIGSTSDNGSLLQVNGSSTVSSQLLVGGTSTPDSTIKIIGSGNFTGRLRIQQIDSTTSPVNMLYQATDGTIKKAAVPAGGGDMVLASAQTVTGAKTFNDTKLLLRNVANTFNGSFTNTNTADRVYTLKDANGTIAFTSDILMNSTDKAFLDSIHYHNSYLTIDKRFDSLAWKRNDSTRLTKSFALYKNGSRISTYTGTTDSSLALNVTIDTTDIANFYSKVRSEITLTTTGTSGAATWSNGVLNIPQYTGGGGGMSIGGAVTSGTTGSVLFVNSGNLAQDNSNLFFDPTKKWLGLGTNAPSHLFDIKNGANSMFAVDSQGRVGLGAPIPSWLDSGGIYVLGTVVGGAYTVQQGGRINWGGSATRIRGAGDGDGNDSLAFFTESADRMVIKDNGDVLAYNGVTSNSATKGIGYSTGAGGTVTQATSKTTGVTINKIAGQITMNAAALAAAAEAKFTVTNSAVEANDVIIVNIKSGGTSGSYGAFVTAVAAGSFDITITNFSAGSLSQAVVLSFVVIKSTNS